MTQAELIELSLRELDQADFLRRVAATNWTPSAEQAQEDSAWDNADLATVSDPWEAAPDTLRETLPEASS